MSLKDPNHRQSFKQLEQKLTLVVLVDFALFILTLITAGKGIVWLKFILGILTLLISAAGTGFLVLINEHRRSRSMWILAALCAMFLCTLVSLIAGYPAPAVIIPGA